MDKCKMCSSQFKRKYRKKGKPQIYCSRKCRYLDSYVQRQCVTCKKQFTKNILSKKSDHFCSLSCIQRYPCQLCGQIITGRIKFQSGEKKFCGRACASFFNQTLKSTLEYIPNGFAKSIKDHGKIICNNCGIEDIQVLVVHHLNRNRKDNSLENLETLCANCHHKIHWGKGIKRMKYVQLAHMIVKYI